VNAMIPRGQHFPGKTLAFTRIDIKDESGKLVAFGSPYQVNDILNNSDISLCYVGHTKFIGKIEVDKVSQSCGHLIHWS